MGFLGVLLCTPRKEKVMHKDTVKGAAKEATGSVKQAVGKATGNERLEAEGAGEKIAGKVQKGVGDLKDAARDALKR